METKSEYKLTEIGKIPVEWDISRMESIGSTYGGLSGKTKDDFEDGNENFVSYRQIFNNPLLKNEDFEMVRIFEKENQNEVKYGDVLFTTSSETPNEVAMSSVFLIEGAKKHFLNSFSFGYRWNQLEIIDPKYYGYYFRGEYFRRLTFKLAQGSTRYNISKNKLVEELIHVPPLKEQQKIAEILSTVDEQIEQTDQLIEKTKELKKGFMQQLLTKGIGHTEFKHTELGEIPVEWELTKIKNIFKVKSGEGLAAKDIINGPYPVYGGNGIAGFNDKYLFDETLLVIGRVGALCGNVNLVTGKSWITDNALYVYNPLQKFDNKFMYYALTTLNLNQFANKNAQPVISGKIIYELSIILPPVKEQQKIAEIISSVDEDIEGYGKEKAKYEELKKGLMQQLLTGKTRVKVD